MMDTEQSEVETFLTINNTVMPCLLHTDSLPDVFIEPIKITISVDREAWLELEKPIVGDPHKEPRPATGKLKHGDKEITGFVFFGEITHTFADEKGIFTRFEADVEISPILDNP